MIPALILALLAVDPVDGGRPGENDIPVLIDADGRVRPVIALEVLPPGSSCMTFDKSASVVTELVDKRARVASLEASVATRWPVVAIVAVAGVLLAGGVGAVAYWAGQESKK